MAKDPGMKKILVYLNGTEESFLAIRYALYFAKKVSADILVGVYVIDERTLDELTRAKVFIQQEEAQYEKDLEDDGRRYISFLEKRAAKENVSFQGHLLRGVVHEEVVGKIKELGVDLLVMGRFEEALSRKDSFYNEEERIFHDCPCPVLVAKEI